MLRIRRSGSDPAGIYATELTREAILEAVRARRVYATTGCRAILRFHLGSVTMGAGPEFWAAPFEIGAEFGGRGIARQAPPPEDPDPMKRRGEATTIAIVATDAVLSKPEAHRVAVAAHDGIGRAIVPAHTLLDGDLVFAAATGRRALEEPMRDLFQIGHAAATCLSRAIARAVFEASPQPGDLQPCWRQTHG